MEHLEIYAKKNPQLFKDVLKDLKYAKSVYNLSKMPLEPLVELFRMATFTRISLLNLNSTVYKNVPVRFNSEIVLNQKFFETLTPTDFYKELYHFFRMENTQIERKSLDIEVTENFNSLFRETVNLYNTFSAMKNMPLHGLVEYPDFKQWLIPDYSVFEKICFDTHMYHIAAVYKNIASDNEQAKEYVNKSYQEFEAEMLKVLLNTPKSRDMINFCYLFDEMYANSSLENKADEYCNYIDGCFETNLEISYLRIYDLMNSIKEITPLVLQKLSPKMDEMSQNSVKMNDYFLMINIRDICFRGDWNNWVKEVTSENEVFLMDDSEFCEAGKDKIGPMERESRITDTVKEVITQINSLPEWREKIDIEKIAVRQKVLFIPIDGVSNQYKELLLNCCLRLRDNGAYFDNSKKDVLAFLDNIVMKNDLESLSKETQKIKIRKF